MYQRPAGATAGKKWRSVINDVHIVGWCSETDEIIGMWIRAYPFIKFMIHSLWFIGIRQVYEVENRQKVDFGVNERSCIPQRVETSGPWCDNAQHGQSYDCGENATSSYCHQNIKHFLGIFFAQSCSNVIQKCISLKIFIQTSPRLDWLRSVEHW